MRWPVPRTVTLPTDSSSSFATGAATLCYILVYSATHWYTLVVQSGALCYTLVYSATLHYTLLHSATLWCTLVHWYTGMWLLVHSATLWCTGTLVYCCWYTLVHWYTGMWLLVHSDQLWCTLVCCCLLVQIGALWHFEHWTWNWISALENCYS